MCTLPSCALKKAVTLSGEPEEAAAMARAIITTDAVGCREVVDDGINGYLCNVRDASDLAKKMEQMLALSSEQRKEMGLCGRAKMVAEFDEQIVIKRYLAAIAATVQTQAA